MVYLHKVGGSLESKVGGWLSIIGGFVLILSIPFALVLMVEIVSEEVGYAVTLGELFGVIQEELPALFGFIIIGIIANIFFALLLLVFGARFADGKGTREIAILSIVIGVFSIVLSIAIIGGIVGLIGGVLGIVGGALCARATVAPPPPPPTVSPQEPVRAPKIRCVYCGTENPPHADFCLKCGKKLVKP